MYFTMTNQFVRKLWFTKHAYKALHVSKARKTGNAKFDKLSKMAKWMSFQVAFRL